MTKAPVLPNIPFERGLGIVFDSEYLRLLAKGETAIERHFGDYFGELLELKLRARMREAGSRERVREETLSRVLRVVRETPEHIEKPQRLGAYVNAVCDSILLAEKKAGGWFPEPPTFMSVDGIRIGEEPVRVIHQVINELPVTDRELMQAIYFEERDKDDICGEFGVSREYLRVLLHRARTRFRQLLDREETTHLGIDFGVTNSSVVTQAASQYLEPEAQPSPLDSEWAELMAKKHTIGVSPSEQARLAELDAELKQIEINRADEIDRLAYDRLARIEANLTRLDKATGELRALSTR